MSEDDTGHLDEWDEAGWGDAEGARPPLRLSSVAPDGRLELLLHPSYMSAGVDRALEMLATHPEGQRVYRQGRRLVLASQGVGDPGVVEMTDAMMAYEVDRVMVVKAIGKDGKERSGPPPAAMIAQMLTGMSQAVGKVRPLSGVLAAPFLAPSGEVVTARGYHAPSGYLMTDDAIDVTVRQAPTQAHAAAALDVLRDVFVDFPYPIEADRHVPIAALLTILASPAIRGNVPAFLFDATTAGSGKTLQQDVISAITTGHVGRKTPWIRDEDERRKTIMAAALHGGPVLAFDNVSREVPFGGADIDMLLTSGGKLAFRGLGAKDLLLVDWRPVILASGNSIGLTGDTNRRVLRGRLETPEEDPENRTEYAHPERANRLVEWVLENRARLLSAALTILRAFCVADRPNPLRLGSFAEWAALVPSAIVYAGGPNVLDCVPRADDIANETDAELRTLLSSWPVLARYMPRVWEVRDLIACLWANERENVELEDVRDAIADACSARMGSAPSSKSVGKLLAKRRGRIMGGRKLDGRRDPHRDRMVWEIVKVTK